MPTRQQLLDAAKVAARSALATSPASAMTALKTNLNADPSTAIPASKPELTKAADEIARINDPRAAREYIESFK